MYPYGIVAVPIGLMPLARAPHMPPWASMMHAVPRQSAAAHAAPRTDFDGHMTSCAICAYRFETGALCVRLGCRHAFHAGCYNLLHSPECPTCRGAEPVVATFTFRGPDKFDEAEEEVALSEAALDETRNELRDAKRRLASALLSTEDLHQGGIVRHGR